MRARGFSFGGLFDYAEKPFPAAAPHPNPLPVKDGERERGGQRLKPDLDNRDVGDRAVGKALQRDVELVGVEADGNVELEASGDL